MRKLLFLAFFVSAIASAQIKIQPINAGFPAKQATDLLVRVLPFETTATTCQLYWELRKIIPEVKDGENVATPEVIEHLAEGNLQLTEPEFALWGADNTYLESIVLDKLGLTRKIE